MIVKRQTNIILFGNLIFGYFGIRGAIMKKFGSVLCLIILMVMASCANTTPVPTGDVTVTLSNREEKAATRAAGKTSRTMLPSELPEISTYTVTLKEVTRQGNEWVLTDDQPIPDNFPGNDYEFKFENVKLGTYTVIVQGIGTTSSIPVVNGTSKEYLTVTADGANEIDVELSLISENGESEYTGAVSMTFDWSDIAKTNATIQEAMKNGGLVFILYRYDESSASWIKAGRSEATGTDATQYKFEVKGLPVSTGLRLKYALATYTGIMLNPILTTPIAQVYSGLTSVQKGNDGSYIYKISENEISSATNVYDIVSTYDDPHVNEGTGIKFTWKNQMQNGECLFDTVTVICYDSKNSKVGSEQVIDVSGETGECIINGLTSGEIYHVTFQAHHKSGLVSPIYTLENVVAEILVNAPENVVATSKDASIDITWNKVANAETYTIYRSVNSGEFSEFKTGITGEIYSDTDVVAGNTYSYKVQAIGSDIESELSEATEAKTIAGVIINIIKPELKDDFEIVFTEMPDVLAITSTQTSLTFSVEAIPEVATYEWDINGTPSQEAKTAEDGGTTFVLSKDSKGIRKDLVNVLNNLRLVLTTKDGTVYSSEEIKFVVSDSASDFDTEINLNLDDMRVASETSKGVQRTIQLNPTYTGTGNFIKAATYESSNEDLATVDDNGLITFKNPNDSTGYAVTITATSFGGHTDDVTFDVYKPTVTCAEDVLNAVNNYLKTELQNADNHENVQGDWWPGISPWYYPTENATDFRIKSSSRTEQEAGEILIYKSVINDNIGNIFIDGKLTIYAFDDYLYEKNWYEAGIIGGYLSTDPLQYVGYNNESLKITLPYNQGSATIKYNKVDVESKNGTDVYEIQFEKVVGFNMDINSTTPYKFDYSESVDLLP